MNKTVSAADILADIGEPTGNLSLWDDAMAAMPEGPLPFLDTSGLPARLAAAGLSAEREGLLRSMAEMVAKDSALRLLAWYAYWRIFLVPERDEAWEAPKLLNRLGDRAGAFYLLLALEFPARLAAWHRRLGYPPEITEHTLRQLACFEGYHLRGRGVPGMFNGQCAWLANYLKQPYVRLGRFEYQFHPYAGGVSAWRRRSDDQVLALAEDNARVDNEGLLLGRDAQADLGWTARLEVAPDSVVGFPIAPSGHILKRQVRLARPDWMPCLAKGDTVLDLHIPPGGAMDWAAITDSFRRALDFFGRHHANQPFSALVVNTWFMDPQLADLLPADSHMLRLQRAVYLYPVPANPGSLWFVFLREMAATPVADLPRETSLQRALAGFLERGGHWHAGGMFLLPADMRAPREGVYRDRFDTLKAEFGIA
jgi:hypothetical protein